MPASILVDYDHIDYFRKYMTTGAKPEFVVFVSNQYGEKVNVYAFGTFPVQEKAMEEATRAARAETLIIQETTQSPSPSRSLVPNPEASARVAESPTSQGRSEQSMQEIANLYYQSMHLFRNRQYTEARPGFEVVLKSGAVPAPMAKTIQRVLIEIDKHLASETSDLQ